MAELSGKAAKVMYGGGDVVSIGSWSIDVNTNILEVTSFTTGTLQWRKNISGLSGWSGSVDAFANAASTGLDDFIANTLTPTTAQFIGYLDKSGGENFRGSCLIESMSVSADIDSTVNQSWGLTGTNALTYSSAT